MKTFPDFLLSMGHQAWSSFHNTLNFSSSSSLKSIEVQILETTSLSLSEVPRGTNFLETAQMTAGVTLATKASWDILTTHPSIYNTSPSILLLVHSPPRKYLHRGDNSREMVTFLNLHAALRKVLETPTLPRPM